MGLHGDSIFPFFFHVFYGSNLILRNNPLTFNHDYSPFQSDLS